MAKEEKGSPLIREGTFAMLSVMPLDPYQVLGVERNASQEDIKRAYRKLSKELHPDRHKGDKDAEQRFKEVNQAYEILNDPKKRQMYDQFGATGSGGAGNGPFGGFDFSAFQGGDFSGFGDLFETFFGGSVGGGRKRGSGRGRDLEVEMEVEMAEVVMGVKKSLTLERQRRCTECDGTGAEKGASIVTCRECGGTGQVTKTAQSFFGAIRQSFVCPTCGGSGKMPERVCKPCGGTGRVRHREAVTVSIPAGIRDGQTLKLTGEGDAGERGTAAGDLYILIHVRPDRRFERDGDDVHAIVTISVIDAILGTEIPVATVHGEVTLKIPAGTQPDQVLRIKGNGMPLLHSSRLGDHYVHVKVEVPAKLSRAEQKLLEEWKKLRE